ncbi:MAG: pyruvate formate-lyase 1 activating enzyme [Clostridiales bacterium]|jgi:putative pyruvate formate lyase activating enzyme|nr:pyruvate formate-lyase 1 activating enzyme [Clostridiales bacterium]
MKKLEKCNLCPRNCGINRINGQIGFCGAGANVKIARSSLHFWEEPCLSGKNGSGTVFFSYCTLKCVFCQNHKISNGGKGNEITVQQLADIFMELQNEGANNINLVTPTHYVPQIIEALKKARDMGLNIPIVYNSSGYEKIETIKMLEGYVDVYLPDFKYFSEEYSNKYSKASDYSEYARSAIDEMVRQVGAPIFDENGIMLKGVIVRHLMLPGLLLDSKKVVEYIYKMYTNSVYISIMNQYTPLDIVGDYPEINRRLNPRHYNKVIDYAIDLGVENAFIQEGDTASESFIPDF